MMVVAILGASPKPDRYANMAMVALREKGHQVRLVNPNYQEIAGLPVSPDLAALDSGSVDTVTMYVGPDRSTPLDADLIELLPRRVIFNPGAENPPLADKLRAAGIKVVEACTLVLLATEQFEK